MLIILTNLVQSKNLTYWITKGTLLGSYRDKGIIPWDVDADIAMDEDNIELFRRLLNSEEIIDLPEDCIIVTRLHDTQFVPLKLINTTNGMYVDLFVYRKNQGQYTLKWPHYCNTCIKGKGFNVRSSLIFPLVKNCEVEGHTFWCPNRTKEYLEAWYGDLSPKPPKWWNTTGSTHQAK